MGIKLFNANMNLKTHLKPHTGGKPFQCSHCHKALPKNVMLSYYMRTYT